MGKAVMSATRLLALALGLIANLVGRRGELGLELAEGGAGGVLLAERCQRHGEPEQGVWRLIARLMFLVAFEEGVGRVLVVAAHVIGLADPVLRVAGKGIVGVARKQLPEGSFRAGVVPLQNRPVALLIERLRIA